MFVPKSSYTIDFSKRFQDIRDALGFQPDHQSISVHQGIYELGESTITKLLLIV
jgi:hypothetical protein